MKNFLIFILLGLVMILSGCASTDQQLGKSELDCGPWNFGIAKASKSNKQFPSIHAAEVEKQACLKTAFANGFDPFDPPLDAKFSYRTEEENVVRKPSRQKVTAVEYKDINSLEEKTPREIKQVSFTNGAFDFQFDAYSDWELSVSPSPLYQIFAKNRQTKAAMFMSVYDQNPFWMWSNTRDSIYMRIREELAYSDLTRFKEFEENGLAVSQIEYRGREKNEAPLHFLGTQIFSGTKIIYLTTWSFEEDYSSNEEEFHKIVKSLKMKTHKLFGLF
jgi:hypothetical protein